MLEASSPVGEKRNLQQAVESEDRQHQRRKGSIVQTSAPSLVASRGNASFGAAITPTHFGDGKIVGEETTWPLFQEGSGSCTVATGLDPLPTVSALGSTRCRPVNCGENAASVRATDRQKHETGLCPCCKENKSLSRILNSVAMGFAVMAGPSMLFQCQKRGFELADSPRPFRVCGACYMTWLRALATANKTQPNEVGKLDQTSSCKQKPVVLKLLSLHLTLVTFL